MFCSIGSIICPQANFGKKENANGAEGSSGINNSNEKSHRAGGFLCAPGMSPV
jgi:hypothetical protein